MTTHAAIRVCRLDELPPGQPRCFRIHEVDVLVVREGERIYAVQNRCGHMSAALHRGEYTDGLIVCPLHGAGFRIETGVVEWDAILPPPMSEYSQSENPRLRTFGSLLETVETLPIRTYAAHSDGQDVFIGGVS
jgi:nitrite reductase/ring-hydroxylating ferredoxin subunit